MLISKAALRQNQELQKRIKAEGLPVFLFTKKVNLQRMIKEILRRTTEVKLLRSTLSFLWKRAQSPYHSLSKGLPKSSVFDFRGLFSSQAWIDRSHANQVISHHRTQKKNSSLNYGIHYFGKQVESSIGLNQGSFSKSGV